MSNIFGLNAWRAYDGWDPQAPLVLLFGDSWFWYAHASGKGVLWFSPWIKPSFDRFKVPEALRPGLIKIIIDRLAQVQKYLEKKHNNYKFVNTRGTLTAAEWSNEIHPTGEGFQKIAAKFYPEFRRRFPDWVVKPKWMK